MRNVAHDLSQSEHMCVISAGSETEHYPHPISPFQSLSPCCFLFKYSESVHRGGDSFGS